MNKIGVEQAPRPVPSLRDKLLSTGLWVVAGAMVVLMVTLVVINPPDLALIPTATVVPTVEPVEPTKTADAGSTLIETSYDPQKSVTRATNPHTEIVDAGRQEAVNYTVAEGDSLFGISKQFDVKPETVFWANYDTLNGSPDMIAPGVELIIPPGNGVYYKWKDGDTIQAVADRILCQCE